MPIEESNHIDESGRKEVPPEKPSEIESILQDIRGKLQPGGPEVNAELLVAYIADSLSEPERLDVQKKLATWETWYHAYWQLCTVIDEDPHN